MKIIHPFFKNSFFLFFFLFIISCQNKIQDKDLQFLNGYWEIEKVILPNGETKEYQINETIDFFQITDKEGFRQKVVPQFDGTYLTHPLKEKFKISSDDKGTFINYQTNYSQWKEEISFISNEKFVVKNAQLIEYHYKRPIKYTLK